MPRKTIADAASQLLAEHRALTANDDHRFRRLTDGRRAAPAQLLTGVTLTHRLTIEEVGRAALALSPDLAPLAALARVGLLLSDGQLLHVRLTGVLLHSPVWVVTSPARADRAASTRFVTWGKRTR
jgi:hypothetical protein